MRSWIKCIPDDLVLVYAAAPRVGCLICRCIPHGAYVYPQYLPVSASGDLLRDAVLSFGIPPGTLHGVMVLRM